MIFLQEIHIQQPVSPRALQSRKFRLETVHKNCIVKFPIEFEKKSYKYYFSEEISTEQKSITMTKKLICVAFSHVRYFFEKIQKNKNL